MIKPSSHWFNLQLIFCILYCKQSKIIGMKTRGQLKREEQQTAPVEKPEKKKTKKELLAQKNRAVDQQAEQKGLGKKKVKAQQQPTVPPTTSAHPAAQGRSRRSKLQAVRVSPEKQPDPKEQKAEKNATSKSKKTGQKESAKVDKDDLGSRPRKDPKEDEDAKKKDDDAKQLAKLSAKLDQIDKDKQDDKEVIKTIQFKGKVPIDEFCNLKNANHHILEYNGKVYSATLNQTKINSNNNKFYIIQIIQNDNNSNSCYFYTRWGRVGVRGQQTTMGPYSAIVAIREYNKKYHEKHDKGDYVEIELNYEDENEDKKDKNDDEDKSNMNSVTNANKKQNDFQKSGLPSQVKRLIQLIFDLKMMNQHMNQIGYNTKKMPLGKLSKNNIQKGYEILKQLMDVIKGKNDPARISQLSGDFFTIIPHDFGFSKMIDHNLNTETKVKHKIEMLEALAEIKVATALISASSEQENQLDSNYKKLNREIKPVEKETSEFELINKYLQSTHGTTHTSYGLELVDLFALNSQVEDLRYTKHIHNKTLLWHGSRLTNFVGILSQGLRIAPPQAPVTGYMFGKGVYFADMSSKSANYCFTSRENSTGILLLCQVALGEMNEKLHADYYAGNLPPGKHSTKGVGRTAPNPANAVALDDGVVVPMGPGEPAALSCTLLYNEFIVYDIAQIRVRYLLRTKFNYRH